MRLLHVLGGLEVGGKERVVLELAERARAQGWDHRLLLFDTPFRDATRDFDPRDVPHAFLPRGPGLDWRFARALARHARALGSEVLHAHNDTALAYVAMASFLLGRRRPRLVATFHARPLHATARARRLTGLASRRMDAITAVSDDLTSFLLDSGWSVRCQTLWNGISLERFAPAGDDGGWRARLGLAADELLVLHVGRQDPLKRQEDLIEAARRLGPRARFLLVGEGPDGERLRSLAAGVPHVTLVGRVHDVAALLCAADLFVLCSASEAAPRVLLEAMATGRAIVATDVGGCRRMLTEESGEPSGVLVPPRDPEALVQALGHLLGDPARRQDLGARARARARDFSDEDEWRGYVALWSDQELAR
jgi:glycosyltransferase involved in cell wall biosynthesis